MLNLVLFGPPGAGKGTQAEFLEKNFNLIHISTGDLLRSEIAAKTELGIEAKKNIDKGELVPDSVVVDMIKAKLNAHPAAHGFIFDGFPRTVAQAKALDRLLEEHGTDLSAMLCLKVETQELIDRLLNRGLTSGRSDDQDRSIIENRISVYEHKTAPLIEYYKAQDKYVPVEGMGTIEQIADRLVKSVEAL
ncbi:adenylate kinase [Prolixibacter sp. NT017]|uniref:adenylate kinase n=1 Tax=Prolixibacter sp. NT017 TaxID=2652390 RepID=UPI001283544A|nr:adenylate kinase [Prolixibacter sp. NT017]GET27688.1 adenylate kinase [Prolixibacter sp. NT017]